MQNLSMRPYSHGIGGNNDQWMLAAMCILCYIFGQAQLRS